MLYRLGKRIPELRGSGHFIGANAAVVDSVILENNVSVWFGAVLRGDNEVLHVGANALVTEAKVIPDNSLVPSSLGKILRSLTEDEIVSMHANTAHYAENAAHCIAELEALD